MTPRPKNHGLTPEAAEALNLQLDGLDTSSAEDQAEAEYIADAGIGYPQFAETGDDIDDGTSRLRTDAPPPPDARDPKAGIPNIDEWMDFFSRIVLRVLCDWYISYAFRGVDEDLLSDREIKRLQLTDEERKRIAVPFAELSHKSKIMRKYGRTIVASGGAFDAIIALGVWTSRVNRIARRYKPRTGGYVINERTGQAEQGTPPDGYATGANGGRIGEGITIINPGG